MSSTIHPQPTPSDQLARFQYLAVPSIWTSFLFHWTVPSISDVWRQFISSQEASNPLVYQVLQTIHRSLKFIYGLTIWITHFSSQDHYRRRSTELGRALNDELRHPKNLFLPSKPPPTIYRDNNDSGHGHRDSFDETELLLASSRTREDRDADIDTDQVEDDQVLSNLMVWRVNWIINHSKRLETTKRAFQAEDCDPSELAEAIIVIKRINPILCSTLTQCLERIKLASTIRKLIEQRSNITYNPELHRNRFKELFKLLKPDQDFDSLPPKGWQLIGFQGTDPSTDLRGAGILGLDALIFFARYFGTIGQDIVTEAVEGGSSWYPWALASINITWWCISLIKSNQLEYFLLSSASTASKTTTMTTTTTKRSSSSQDQPKNSKALEDGGLMTDIPEELREILIVQVKLTYLFHQFWIDLNPKPTVMEFESKFKVFKSIVQVGLSKGLIGGLGLGWMVDRTCSKPFPFCS